MTGARGAFAGLGQAGAGNARSKGCAKRVPATSQEAWPEAASLAMKDSLGREPRGTPEGFPPPPHPPPRKRGRVRVGAAAVPVFGAAEEPCVCRRFASDFFFLFFFCFVIAGLDPAIYAAVPLARRLHQRLCKLLPSMDHRIKSGGDESESV